MKMNLFQTEAKAKKKPEVGLKTDFVGTDFHVNPSPETTLARKEGRLHRVKLALAQGNLDEEKRLWLEKAKRRLEMEIAIKKGDY